MQKSEIRRTGNRSPFKNKSLERKKHMSANQLSLSSLREFAPSNSPLFAYRIESSGSPMNDWARHISNNNLFRRELEENSVLGGNVVVRAVEGDEQPALERVKILSLSYATRVSAILTTRKSSSDASKQSPTRRRCSSSLNKSPATITANVVSVLCLKF